MRRVYLSRSSRKNQVIKIIQPVRKTSGHFIYSGQGQAVILTQVVREKARPIYSHRLLGKGKTNIRTQVVKDKKNQVTILLIIQ